MIIFDLQSYGPITDPKPFLPPESPLLPIFGRTKLPPLPLAKLPFHNTVPDFLLPNTLQPVETSRFRCNFLMQVIRMTKIFTSLKFHDGS